MIFYSFLFFFVYSHSKDNIFSKIDQKFEVKFQKFVKKIKDAIKEEEYGEIIEEINDFMINNLSISDEQYNILRTFKIDILFLSNNLEEATNLCGAIVSSKEISSSYKAKLMKRLFLFCYYNLITGIKINHAEIEMLYSMYIEQNNFQNEAFDCTIKEFYDTLQDFKQELIIEELINYTESTDDINFIMNYISECNKDRTLLKDPVVLYAFVYYLIHYKLYSVSQLQDLIDEVQIKENNTKYNDLFSRLKDLE